MAFLVPAFRSLKKACNIVPVLCAIHLIVTLCYVLYSDNGLTIFWNSQRSLPQNVNLSRNYSDDMISRIFRKTGIINETVELPKCPETSPLLVGPLKVEFNESLTLGYIEEKNPELRPGGRWRPADCVAQQKVAIIIPFRDRESHLKQWLFFLHPILQRQQLDYTVYIINQAGETIFNKARLMDAGFLEALKEYDYDCFVFSDVDIIPMDDRNTFKCYSQPRHLAVALDKFGYLLPYQGIYGGVTALSKAQFLKINGFPTNYWGWGGEDDDISYRLSFKGMSISRPDAIVGRCRMIRHPADRLNQQNPKRFNNLAKTKETMDRDGVNTVRYDVVRIDRPKLYTNITIDVGTP